MAISTFSELQSAAASFLHRSDLTSEIQDFIRLAEADLQVRGKLSQWDTSASVTFNTGTGSLPSDFAHAQSLTYATDNYTLDFSPHSYFDGIAAPGETGTPTHYTIRGSNIYVYPLYTGDMTLAYTARFTPLSGSATTNSLLTLFPDVYLNGTLYYACVWDENDAGLQKYKALFEEGINRVKRYMLEFKYPDVLQMKTDVNYGS